MSDYFQEILNHSKRASSAMSKLSAEDRSRILMNISGFLLSNKNEILKGYGRQKGHTELYRGAEYEVHFLPKSRAEILVDSADVEKVITTVSEAVKSGKIGDGKIFVTEVQDVVRIRTGERGAEAIK